MKQISAIAIFVFAVFYLGSAKAEDKTGANEIVEKPITAEDRQHWSFQPLERPPLPEVEATDWQRNPIDRFILAGLQNAGLKPMPAANRTTLIRRVTFDLTGLPPTADEIDAFVRDDRPDAYEQLIDRLLASPAYGERWALHWLDLARFAETDGFEHDKIRPQAWRYRDWVIDALNSDMPYGEFVNKQLAGDELFPGDADAARATAFCLSGPDMPDINSQEERRSNLLNEMTGTVGSVFLGLQMGCAQCHDHIYDPVSQADFYRLRAVFEPAVKVRAGKSVDVLAETGTKTEPSYLLVRGDWRRRGKMVQPGFPRIANPTGKTIKPPAASYNSSRRRAALARWIAGRDNPLTWRVIANRIWHYHFGAGLSRTPSDLGIVGDEPWQGELLDYLASELIRESGSLKQLHRLILTSAAYRQAGSADSCQANRAVATEILRNNLRKDPDNRLWGRYNRRRLEGETIRDAMLTVAGLMNRQMAGPSVRPPLPREVISTLLNAKHWEVSPQEADHYRRSVYVFVRRNLHYPMFAAFDRPDGNASCPVRSRSTTAPQSLVIFNSEFSLLAARNLAGHALAYTSNDRNKRIQYLYHRLLGRKTLPEELARCRQFLTKQAAALQQQQRPRESLALPLPCPAEIDIYEAVALTDLCLVMFNLNEFVYVD